MKSLRGNRVLVILSVFLIVIGIMLSANSAEAGILKKIKKMFKKAQEALFTSVVETVDDGSALTRDDASALHRRAISTYDNATNPERIVREEGGTPADMESAEKLEDIDDDCGTVYGACLENCRGKYPGSEETKRLKKCYKKCNRRMDKCNEPTKVEFSN